MEKVTRKKKLGGYPATGVVVSTTLALFVIGIFGLILMYSHQFERVVRENISFKVYLKSSLSETQRQQVRQNLAAQEFVAKTEQPITFTSREDAGKELVGLGDYEEILGDNPFKDMFEVAIDPAYHDSASLNSIKADLEKINGVMDAVYEKDLLADINKNATTISLVLMGIDLILLITVVLLINNTLRLALFSQRFLIRSMQLVGAKKWFIQRPFLVRAGFYGLLSGAVAGLLLYVLTQLAYRRVEQLDYLHNENLFRLLLVSLLVAGILLAVVSTYFAIRKYLRMTLDELY